MNGGDAGGAAAAAAGNVNANLNGNAPPPFLSKTYDMVDDPSTNAIVTWGKENNSFVVVNPPEFATNLLPKYFKHNNFSSFVRQLNTYGFKKVDPDNWEFANEGFLRGKKHLLKTIVRKKPTSSHNQPHHPQTQNNSVGACVEVGKFGLEEEIERLKRDKNVLMQELVRLRQQQQSTDHQLQTLGKQLQGMERRQQQMVSFLAKAMQSPGFFAQFVKHNDSNRRISAGSKKRRLSRQENKLDDESTSPDVQIIKYQPLINEAAKAMLRQIVKDASPRLESFNNSDNFLLENVPSSLETLDSRSISTSNSGVTLSEVPTSSAVQNPPTSSAFSFSHSSSAASEIQSPAGLTNMDTSEIPDISMLSGVLDAVSSSQSAICIPEFAQFPGMVPNSNHVDFPVKNYAVPEAGSVYADPSSALADGPVSIEEEFLDTDLDFSIDEGNELPGINDVFWEQFLTGPMPGDADEADSTTLEVDDVKLELENGNNNFEKMQSLTEQMGLLVSGAKRQDFPNPKTIGSNEHAQPPFYGQCQVGTVEGNFPAYGWLST